MEANCIRCGVQTQGTNCKYCNSCRAIAKKENNKRAKRKEALRKKLELQKIEDRYTVLKDPDDAWIPDTQFNKCVVNQCLSRAIFTEGTIIKNVNNGILYRVAGNAAKTPGAKASRSQVLTLI